MKRFRGGLLFQAHRLLYHSTLGLRVIKKKRRRRIDYWLTKTHRLLAKKYREGHAVVSTRPRPPPLELAREVVLPCQACHPLLFRVSGFAFLVSGFRFQFSGSRFRVSGFEFLVILACRRGVLCVTTHTLLCVTTNTLLCHHPQRFLCHNPQLGVCHHPQLVVCRHPQLSRHS